MPRRPKKVFQKRGIPENIWRFLNDEHPDPGNDVDIFLLGEGETRKLWDESRVEIMDAWISKHPGTRPSLWWEYDSLGNRERIGGKGRLTCEKWPAVLQLFEQGLPTGWESIDAADPATFESEAAYLQRHGLLTDAEKKFIAGHPELLEPEKITSDFE